MIEKFKGNTKYFQFEKLSKQKGLFHFSSTRESGNMAFSGSNSRYAKVNLKKFLKSLGISLDQSVFGYQVHKDNVAYVNVDTKIIDNDTGLNILPESDSLITSLKGKCLIVKTADCCPIILYDPNKDVVATVHSGWKGALLNVVGKTVQKMIEEFGTNPKDLLAGIGPSLGPDDFYIRSDVAVLFEKDGIRPESMLKVSDDQWLLNIWEITKGQLLNSGLTEENIEIAGVSTYTSIDFFSYRKKNPEGHFITGAMII